MKTQTLLHKSARFIAVVMSIMVMTAMMPMLYAGNAVYADDTAVAASQETAFTLDGKAYTRDQITAMESKQASHIIRRKVKLLIMLKAFPSQSFSKVMVTQTLLLFQQRTIIR